MDNLYTPFPVVALPEPVKSYMVESAAAIGCDAAYIALPGLSALASSIGAGYRIQLKPNWTEPAVIWTGTIGEWGTCKSPAMKLAMDYLLRKKNAKRFMIIGQSRAQYLIDKDQYDRAYDTWRKRR